jgi:hypothetical protein
VAEVNIDEVVKDAQSEQPHAGPETDDDDADFPGRMRIQKIYEHAMPSRRTAGGPIPNPHHVRTGHSGTANILMPVPVRRAWLDGEQWFFPACRQFRRY